MRLVGEVGPEGQQGRNQKGGRTRRLARQDPEHQGSRIKDQRQGSRIKEKDQGSRIKDPGARIEDQGSRMKAGGRTQRPARQEPEDQGSRIMDLVL